MPGVIKNKIIAVFFLMIFSASTITGFACSIGIDMGYNSKHHVHEHNGSHASHDKGQIHHEEGGIGPSLFDTSDQDDCCTHSVAKFEQLDKRVADNQWTFQTPVFLLAFTSAYLNIIHTQKLAVNNSFNYWRRSCSLNDTDIRIAIQSFQI